MVVQTLLLEELLQLQPERLLLCLSSGEIGLNLSYLWDARLYSAFWIQGYFKLPGVEKSDIWMIYIASSVVHILASIGLVCLS